MSRNNFYLLEIYFCMPMFRKLGTSENMYCIQKCTCSTGKSLPCNFSLVEQIPALFYLNNMVLEADFHFNVIFIHNKEGVQGSFSSSKRIIIFF